MDFLSDNPKNAFQQARNKKKRCQRAMAPGYIIISNVKHGNQIKDTPLTQAITRQSRTPSDPIKRASRSSLFFMGY
jgi:hypothetical protein